MTRTPPMRLLALYALVAMLGLWSFIGATDRLTWWMEACPALIGLPLALVCWPRFPWSALAVTVMCLHASILLVGAHYTYALAPPGVWLQQLFHFSRNNYDRIGHLAQGAFPAILAREVLSRVALIRSRRWLAFLSVTFCLAFSALYELIEWWSALALGADANAFLATQGDPWDTQWDMFMALIGATLSLLAFTGWHDRQLLQFASTRH